MEKKIQRDDKKRPQRKTAKVFKILSVLIIIAAIAVFLPSIYLQLKTADKIFKPDNLPDIKAEVFVVLGAGVKNGRPSPMLQDRLDSAKAAYDKFEGGIKILCSGAHESEYYNEPAVMKEYLEALGVPSDDILCDGRGYSTYESISRAKREYNYEKIYVVTQKYHLYRSLYLAAAFDIEAYGVNADARPYMGQLYREIREILARDKDFVLAISKP